MSDQPGTLITSHNVTLRTSQAIISSSPHLDDSTLFSNVCYLAAGMAGLSTAASAGVAGAGGAAGGLLALLIWDQAEDHEGIKYKEEYIYFCQIETTATYVNEVDNLLKEKLCAFNWNVRTKTCFVCLQNTFTLSSAPAFIYGNKMHLKSFNWFIISF